MIQKIIVFAVLLILFWFILPLFTGKDLNAGNAAGIVLCLSVLAVLHHWEKIAAMGRLWKILLLLTAAMIFGDILICIVLMISSCIKKPADTDTLIVLGCRVFDEEPGRILQTRVDQAALYLKKHPECRCIVSGGKGDDENISEAEAMYRSLVKQGIEPERIIKEDQSTTTYENFRFSLNYINDTVIVVTSEFHEFRAKMIASAFGIKAYALPAPTPWWLLLTYAVRETICIPYELLKLKRISR